MSASIHWESVKDDQNTGYLCCWAPQSFMRQIEESTGCPLPAYLGIDDIPILEKLAKTNCDGGGNPFQEVITAINKHGSLRVWPEY